MLASGGGSNAERIMRHFAGHADARVVGVVSDRKAAGVLERARLAGVPARFVGRVRRQRPGGLLAVLRAFEADLVVLAGYLQLVPADVIAAYPERVLNIHPALLPAYGGAGMYGRHVHEAVVAARETHSGITVHLADDAYDRGRILFQARTPIDAAAGAREVARRVLALEHQHYPLVIEAYVRRLRTPSLPLGVTDSTTP